MLKEKVEIKEFWTQCEKLYNKKWDCYDKVLNWVHAVCRTPDIMTSPLHQPLNIGIGSFDVTDEGTSRERLVYTWYAI